VTTISGPPLAILFNNQGLVKDEFRAGLALVRVAESSVTAFVYYQLNLFIAENQTILLTCIASVFVGIPLGAFFFRGLDAETFRRICMSFDAWVVGFGLSRVFIDLKLANTPWAYSVMVGTILIDSYLLYRFFRVQRAAPTGSHTMRTSLTASDRSEPHKGAPSAKFERPSDPFGGFHTLLGYIIGIAAIAMLVYAFRLQP
jgi:uncharacterized protein